MGALDLLGIVIPEAIRRRRDELRQLRPGRARDRARRFGLPLDDERAGLAGDGADQRVRHRGAEAEVPAEAGHRRVDRLLRPDRAQLRIRSGRHDRRARRKWTAATRSPAPSRGSRNSPIADVFIVWAKDDEGDIRGFILEKGMKGLSAPPIHGKVGLRTSITGEVVMDNVFCPEENAFPRGPRAEGPVHVPQQRALRHLLGRAGRGRGLLAPRPQLRARAQAVRPAAGGESADPEEARRHADRDRARPAGGACGSAA